MLKTAVEEVEQVGKEGDMCKGACWTELEVNKREVCVWCEEKRRGRKQRKEAEEGRQVVGLDRA